MYPNLIRFVLPSIAALTFGTAVCNAQLIQTTGATNYSHNSTTDWTIDGSDPTHGPNGLQIGSFDTGAPHDGVGSMVVNGGLKVINNSNGSGADQSGNGFLGWWVGTKGTATISGNASLWSNEQNLFAGVFGEGKLNIDSGGVVTNLDGVIGTNNGSVGNVTVSSGGQWNSSNALIIGYFGGSQGTLNVETGGSVSSDRLYLGGSEFGAGGDGTINISTNATVAVNGTMQVWEAGVVNLSGGVLDVATLDLMANTTTDDFNMTGGRLVVESVLGDLFQDGGTLAPGDSPGLSVFQNNYEITANGTIEFELAGLNRGTEYDAINVGGQAILNGKMDVNLMSAFAVEGDAFQLVSAMNGITVLPLLEFEFSGVDLDAGLAWYTGDFASTGTISVISAVPEPGSLAILAGLCVLAVCRRQRKIAAAPVSPAGLPQAS